MTAPDPHTPALATLLPDVVTLTSLAPGGVVLASPQDGPAIEARLVEAGWLVVPVDTAQATRAREAQAVIASALRLPASAARNLDALVDALRDLPEALGGARRTALSWRGVQGVAEADPAGYAGLVDALGEASESLWGQAGSGGYTFETVLLDGRPR